MEGKQYQWHKVAESTAEVTQRGERSVMEATIAGKEICIVHYKDNLYACNAKCPHAGGRISHGFVDANGNVVCPLHQYRFNVKNGINSSGEGYHLKTYPVIENDDGVFVGIEKSNP